MNPIIRRLAAIWGSHTLTNELHKDSTKVGEEGCACSCGSVWDVRAQQIWSQETCRVASAIASTHAGMGRYFIGFYRRFANVCRYICFNGDGGPPNKISPLYHLITSIHCTKGCKFLCGNHCSMECHGRSWVPITVSLLASFGKIISSYRRTNSRRGPHITHKWGQTEVVNWCPEQYLRCFTNQQPRIWSHFLAWTEFWYNTIFHQSVGMTHFQALYDQIPPIITDYLVGISPMEKVDQELVMWDKKLKQLKHNLEQGQNLIK